jgi:glutamate formiminotransferase
MLPSLGRLAQPTLVACNVYISAGLPKYANLLTNLLEQTQDHCFQLRKEARNGQDPKTAAALYSSNVVVVHAFCDGPYNRSSFHIAGSPHLVVDAASSLITNTINALLTEQQGSAKDSASDNATPHPTVGLVDHVSVLPLDNDKARTLPSPGTGPLALQIGQVMQKIGVDVLYYGYAHPDRTPLATVRREKTKFFQTSKDNANPTNTLGQATVGAPECFTENFNIRLTAGTSRKIAQSLTRHIRKRNGRGLPFVEALTLPYSKDRYEVACNLLNPTVTSAHDVQERVKSWEYFDQGLVEMAYRVGTTPNMCLEALQAVNKHQGGEIFNQKVMERFQGFIAEPQ